MTRRTHHTTHLIKLFLGISLVVAVLGCDNFNLYQQFPALDAAGINIVPSVAAVLVTKTLNFQASGGGGGYVFSVQSGGGTIDPFGGVYTAPAVTGSEIVRVTDRFGDFREATVAVIEAQNLFITPMSVYVGIGETFDFAAFGGVLPYTFSILPDGAGVDGAINSTTGLYSAPGVYDAGDTTDVVRVTDGALAQRDAVVTIVDAGGPLFISPASPVIGEFGSVAFFGSGGTGSYSFSVLVDGDLDPDGYIASVNIYHPNGARGTDADEVELFDGSTTTSTFVTVVPAAPENLVANGAYPGPQTIELTWNEVSVFADEYRIERQEAGSSTWVDVATIAAGTASYLDSGLSPSINYYVYRVLARFFDGITTLESDPSNLAIDASDSM